MFIFSAAFFTYAVPAAARCTVYENMHDIVRDMYLTAPQMNGQDILKLQKALKKIDFYSGKLDGVYGPETKKAVASFQKANDMKPDGIAGPVTRSVMESKMNSQTCTGSNITDEDKVDILIDTRQRVLHVLVNGEPYRRYSVAVGKRTTPTPIGTWEIKRKALNWGTGFGTRWIGITAPWGIYGVHGTNKPNSIGSYASHGCIRMHNKNVEEVYPMVKKDSRIIIVGNAFTYRTPNFRLMRRNSRGSDVMEIQRIMKEYGYYEGPVDGIWGRGMEQAVIQFRKDRNMKHDNCVDNEVYKALGI